jgi:hypothetical protein
MATPRTVSYSVRSSAGCADIVTHPSVPGLMYIRANIGGAYRWDSALELWTPITDWISGPECSLLFAGHVVRKQHTV